MSTTPLRTEQAESQFYLDTLRELVSIPTAPFFEEAIGDYICQFLKRFNLPYEIDQYGNIIARYQKGEVRQSLTLMAHTDHPAFELENRLSEPNAAFPEANWSARLLGGVGLDWFKQPCAVKVFPANDRQQPLEGQLLGAELIEQPRAIRLFLKLAENSDLTSGNFGIWSLTDFELTEDFIHARVIDDLVGCAAALLSIWKLAQEEAETNLWAVFTRAEEVGLVGAELIFKQNILPADTFVVSIEASKTLPGAIQGEGPVIRVGDRGFTFSEEAEFILKKAADRLVPLKTQRQLMSGGGCEASAAIMQGYSATGLAFPLGNYHNMTSDFRLAPENIHLHDYLGGITLLQEAARLLPRLDQIKAEQLAARSASATHIERLVQTRPNYAGF